MAKIIGISQTKTQGNTSVYDPTCGSGSLLLKVAAEAHSQVTLNGQEKEAVTAGLARMNMILHDNPTALIYQGNTLSNPLFMENGQLKTFDYVVANPLFSDKRWNTGVNTENEPYQRFEHFGIPPDKQGDYAYLLHIVHSLKSTGKGACILPHGVLFRGNAEAEIRKNLIKRGYIKGIIGLPANLFYGTGIPACIIVIDKENAHQRNSIFMLDASRDYMKDGNKNRLRDRDIHKIVDVFNKNLEIQAYSRRVNLDEIEKNDFNLNIPRYIDSQQKEDIEDIEAHLKGGIPIADIEALNAYWKVCPKLKADLFKDKHSIYVDLSVSKQAIKSTIYQHPEFVSFIHQMNAVFEDWQNSSTEKLKSLQPDCKPKETIFELSEDLLIHYTNKPLMDNYAIYQHLMDYWADIMQDDCYLISEEGWQAKTYRIIEEKKNKQGQVVKSIDKGWACDLVPKSFIEARYFSKEQAEIENLQAQLETLAAKMQELEEEHSGDEGLYAELEKVNKANVSARLKEIKGDITAKEEEQALNQWLKLYNQDANLKKELKQQQAALDKLCYEKYPHLTEAEIKTLVVDDKWIATLSAAVHGEMDRISQTLSQRIKELAERYETPLPQLTTKLDVLAAKVDEHLAKMGFSL